MKKSKVKKKSMADFNTVDKATAGVEMPLTTPDGEESGQFLIVCGQDSPAFVKAMQVMNLKLLHWGKNKKKSKELTEEETEQRSLEFQTYKNETERELVETLVIGWSFEEPFHKDSLKIFLDSAPYLQDQINNFAGDRENFLGKPSSDS